MNINGERRIEREVIRRGDGIGKEECGGEHEMGRNRGEGKRLAK